MRARVVAPLVAAILGISGGVITAVVTTETKTEKPTAFNDPLGVGIPMVDLECNPSQGVLVLGFGDTAPALLTAIKDEPDPGKSYLDTANSCDTIYGPERRADPPDYAVILGPFDDLIKPCQLRMDPDRRGAFVTKLKSGNEITVKCVCVLPDSASRPTLSLGMQSTPENQVWVRSLQGMLNDVRDEEAPEISPTGIYDRPTEAIVKDYQESSGRDVTGVVDDDTWRLITKRICPTYDF